jgi:hypothetical protein
MLEFRSILHLVNSFQNEQSCIDHLENLRWDGAFVSPFDSSSTVYKCKGNKYKCKITGKYFYVRTGTIFDNTKTPLQKCFLALYVFSSIRKGVSSHRLAKDNDATQKSAWFVLDRLSYAFEKQKFKSVFWENPIEIDETYVGRKESNKHLLKKEKGTQGRNTKSKLRYLE